MSTRSHSSSRALAARRGSRPRRSGSEPKEDLTTSGVQQETPTKRELAASLSRAREATLRLIGPVDDEQLVAQVSPILSPLVWDLAHIGWFEEL